MFWIPAAILMSDAVYVYSNIATLILGFCSVVKLGAGCYSLAASHKKARTPKDVLDLFNFSDGLFSLVLTQSAVLGIFSGKKAAMYHGAFGVFIGIGIVVLGIYSVLRLQRDKGDS